MLGRRRINNLERVLPNSPQPLEIMTPAKKLEVWSTFDRRERDVELIYANCDAGNNVKATALQKLCLVGPDGKIERSTFFYVLCPHRMKMLPVGFRVFKAGTIEYKSLSKFHRGEGLTTRVFFAKMWREHFVSMLYVRPRMRIPASQKSL